MKEAGEKKWRVGGRSMEWDETGMAFRNSFFVALKYERGYYAGKQLT